MAILAVGALLTLKGNDAAQHVGEMLLGGAAIGMYASRKPGGGSGDPPGGTGGPIDPGLVVTLVGGVAAWLTGHGRAVSHV